MFKPGYCRTETIDIFWKMRFSFSDIVFLIQEITQNVKSFSSMFQESLLMYF